MKKLLLWLMVVTVAVSMVAAFSLAGCKTTTTETTAAETTAAATAAETTAAETTAAAKAAETTVAETTAGQTSEYTIPKGDWVIGLSNSYYGNTWRKQMVDSFTAAGQMAKDQGLIKDFEVQNGDNTVNAQIAQINSFILKKVDILCINAASPTALNSVIEKAVEVGIVVLAFDSIVTTPVAYTMDYDWAVWGKTMTDYVVKRLNGQGNIIVSRGPSGSLPDIAVHDEVERILNQNPGIKKLAEISGEANAVKAQEEMLKILPSFPKIDAVTVMGGSAGIANAFEQSKREEIPIIIGDNSSEFIQWWINKKKTTGYETMSINSTPGCGSAALWTALNILNKVDVPKNMMLGLITISQDQVEQYADMEPGTLVSPVFTNDYVMKNIIEPAR